MLELAKKAGIPVVVADIGTNSGDYVSFIISDNYEGAHGVGEALAAALKEKGWQNGSVGLITISQARKNGQARTAGLPRRHDEGGVTTKEAGLQQMQSYTADETFKFTQDMLTANPDMRGLFIQTDQPALGALARHQGGPPRRRRSRRRLRRHSGIRRSSQIGRDRRLRHAAALSHGREAPAKPWSKHLAGKKPEKEISVPIVVVTSNNIDQILPTIKRPCSPTKCNDPKQ